MNIRKFNSLLLELTDYIICSEDNLILISSHRVCVPSFLVCVGVEKQLQSTGS